MAATGIMPFLQGHSIGKNSIWVDTCPLMIKIPQTLSIQGCINDLSKPSSSLNCQSHLLLLQAELLSQIDHPNIVDYYGEAIGEHQYAIVTG